METASYSVKGTSAWDKETGAQDEGMSYDRNGNILTLQRKQRKHALSGVIASYTSETVDNLTYAYKSSDKNSLEKVTDAASTSAAAGFDNGSSSTSNDYTYDANGNLLSDKNKGIDSVKYNFLGKPVRMKFSDGKVITYVYDAGGNKLTQKLYNGATIQTTTHYVNGFVYEAVTTGSPALSFFGSPEGRVVNNSGALTYEYSIADHQGNTRVVFTSATISPLVSTANFESGTNTDFPNYTTAVRSSLPLFNHTTSGTYSQKLTGASGANTQVGIARTLKVYPGDKVKIDAYAKYYNPTSPASNIAGFALALTGAFGVTSSSTGEMLKAYNTLNNYGGIIAAGGSGDSSSHPKLFVNILLFDKDYNFLDAAWEQIDGGEQIGVTPTAHDLMSKEITVKEAGFAYVFVSNENPTLVEFYVDDVVITHTPTNVTQYNEYYPFGLQTSSSWTREQTKDNNYLYNAANELNKTSGWYEMYYRGYDPAIGRMLQIDPYATMYASSTTYNYALNNPVMMNDPNGGQSIQGALNSIVPTTRYMATRYEAWGNDWGMSPSGSQVITGAYDSPGAVAAAIAWYRYGIADISKIRTPSKGVATSASFWFKKEEVWYGLISNYDEDGALMFMTAALTAGYGEAMTTPSQVIYDREAEARYDFISQNSFGGGLGPGWADFAGLGLDAADDVMDEVIRDLNRMQQFSNEARWGLSYGGEMLKANRISTGMTWGARGLGAYNGYTIFQNYRDGKISDTQFVTEQFSNGFSTLGGLNGAAWGLGWEIGRAITTIPAYQEWKQNTWMPFRNSIYEY